jgi:hypothetical protein
VLQGREKVESGETAVCFNEGLRGKGCKGFTFEIELVKIVE